MHNAIHTESQTVSLNNGKINVIFNSHAKPTLVIVDGNTIEEVDSYVYIGKKIASELKIRIELGLAVFGKVYNVKRNPKAVFETKRNLFNEYVLPVMNYGSET